MAAIQFTFTRIGSMGDGSERAGLLLDDGFGRPEVVLLPPEIFEGLRELAIDPAQFRTDAGQLTYGERLCELLVRSPAMARVQAYLLPYLGGADRSLQLLFDVQESVLELGEVSWELLSGLHRAAMFDALDALDPNRCIARVVRGASNLKLLPLPTAKLNVILWTPLREDTTARDVAMALYDRLNKLGDSVRPVAPPSADLQRLAQLALDDGHVTILHIITHGMTDALGNVRVLTDGGSRDAMGLEMQLRPLAPALHEGRMLGAILDVCHGGGGKRSEASPGRRLVQAGFPFAIAAEAPLDSDAAVRWSGEFYRSLANDASLYQAVSSARTTTADAASDSFAWSRQRLFLTNTLARRFGQLLEQPILDVETPAPPAARNLAPRVARTGRGRFSLRDTLLPLQKKCLAALEFAVSTLIEELDVDGVRFGDGHLERVERTLDELASGLQQAQNPLRCDEAMVLLSLVQLYSLGWMAVPPDGTAEDAARALLAASEELDGSDGAHSELSRILEQLRIHVEELAEIWRPLQQSLAALSGGLAESTRPFEGAAPNVFRPLLLAALLRLAESLDAGLHRLDQYGMSDAGSPSVARWLHTYSRRGSLAHGAIRFAFHVPDSRLLPVVKLAAAAPMWADRHGALDTLVQAGLALCVLPPSVEVPAATSSPSGDSESLSEPQGLIDVLAVQLRSSHGPRLQLVPTRDPIEQYPFAPFACGGVDARDNTLHLPAPAERRRGGTILFQIAKPNGELIMPPTSVELGPDEHVQVDCDALRHPPLLPLRWTLSVPRWPRNPITHEGIFWLLKPGHRRRCIEQLGHFSAHGDRLEQTLAQASILRSYGCWSASLTLLIEASNSSQAEDRLPLFAAMTGIYDRMLIVLSQMPGAEAIAARVRSNQEAVWRVYHQTFGVDDIDHHESARHTALVLLRAAGLSAPETEVTH